MITNHDEKRHTCQHTWLQVIIMFDDQLHKQVAPDKLQSTKIR